jgi:polysaccharide biosynthesis protein PslG
MAIRQTRRRTRGPVRGSAWHTAGVNPRRLLLPIIFLLTGSAILVPSASATPTGGVQSVPVGSMTSQRAVDTTLDRAKALDAKLIRVDVVWSQLEPKAAGVRNASYLAAADRLVDGAAARGMRVLLLVAGTPCWASSAPARGTCSGADANRSAVTRYPPADPADYVPVATFLAARYGAKLAAFEVWNEPDQSNELYWAGPDKVKRYVALAQAAYGPLKAANPQMTVLAGAFVGGNGKWLQALYSAGIKGSYDSLSVHFYDLPLEALRQTRAVQKRNGDTKPLWLAETGFSSCYKHGRKDAAKDHVCLTRAGQAQALTDLFAAIRQTSWLKAAIVYTLQDESTAYQFGLYQADGKRKPAGTAVRKAFANKTLRATKPTLRLTARKGQVVLHGTGSWVEVYSISVTVGGKLRYKAYVRTDRFGRITLALPQALGTSHVKVDVKGRWTHKQVVRSTS